MNSSDFGTADSLEVLTSNSSSSHSFSEFQDTQNASMGTMEDQLGPSSSPSGLLIAFHSMVAIVILIGNSLVLITISKRKDLQVGIHDLLCLFQVIVFTSFMTINITNSSLLINKTIYLLNNDMDQNIMYVSFLFNFNLLIEGKKHSNKVKFLISEIS